MPTLRSIWFQIRFFAIILRLSSFKLSGVRVTQSFVCCVVICKSLFVLLYFFYWSSYCVYFSDLRLLITPLVSSLIFHCFYMPLVSKISIFFPFVLTLYCTRIVAWFISSIWLSISLTVTVIIHEAIVKQCRLFVVIYIMFDNCPSFHINYNKNVDI